MERPAQRHPSRNGYHYKPQFGLIVVCKDEADQRRKFARMTKLGYRPKVVCV
ncbi:MAG: hypothetical protein K2Q27_11920 [Novosphingobium sp.]|nr:hypothetical protein [Novosphingobium sp.]